MSLFGRALAGAGSGASEIASKYIDESIVEQRAQVLADIARRGRMQEMKDTDEFTNDPERRARMAALAGQDTIAAAGATDQATLNRVRNGTLTQATIDQSNAVTEGTMGADAKKAGLMAKAQAAAKPIELQPGGIAFDSAGNQIAANNNMTPAEATLASYREQLRGASHQQKNEAYKSLADSTNAQLRDVQKSLNEGLAGGMMKKPPKDYDPSKPDAAVEAYLDLDKQRRVLAKAQRDIQEQWQADLRGGSGGGGAAAAPRGDKLGVFDNGPANGEGATPEIFRQAAREYLDKLGANPSPEKRDELERELATLVARAPAGSIDLDKLKRTAVVPGAPAPAAPAPAPAAPPAAPAAPRMTEQQKHDAAQAAARLAASPEGRAQAERAIEQERAQFDQDVEKMAPVDLLRKYDSYVTRARLTKLQLVQLNRIQRGL